MNEPIHNDDLDEESVLLRQMQAVQARLDAIRKEKDRLKQEKFLADEAERIRIEAEKIFVVKVSSIDELGKFVLIKAEFRADFLKLLQNTAGRSYYGSATNAIPINSWGDFKKNLCALPKIKLVIDIDQEVLIAKILSIPTYEVSLGKYEFEIVSRAEYNILYPIPGCQYHSNPRRIYTVPFSEGYRLFETLEKEKVKYTDEAKNFVVKQIENRAKLDRTGTMERGEIYKDFKFINNDGVDSGYTLRPFQEVTCDFAEATDIRCLIALEMGLGKSPVSIAIAHKNKFKTLVVCPASLRNNWARQILKFTGLRPKVLRGAEPTRLDIVNLLTDPDQFTIINYDILGRKVEYKNITKNKEGWNVEEDMTRFPWAEVLNMAKFDLVIYDEAHYFKNQDSNRSQAVRTMRSKHVLPMTGTPVLNRPGELWPILHMINPQMFPAFDTFVRQYTRDGKTALNVEQLKNTLKTLMIRRLKRDVKKDLPPINRIHEFRELSDKAEKLYQRVLAGIYRVIDAAGNEWEQAVTHILAQIMRLKQVCALDMAQHSADLAVQFYDQTDESEKRKVMICSQFKPVAYKILQILGNEAIGFVSRSAKTGEFITANMSDRDKMILEFQTNPDVHFLVVTEKTTKEGHDITEAGAIIVNDLFWTPAGHEQLEGRAYGRESDSHNIDSYFMITSREGNSINEWIMELLADKMRMIEQVVEGVEGARDVSVAMDLIRKLKEFR